MSDLRVVADAWAFPVACVGARSSAPPISRSLARVGFLQAFRAGVQELPAAPDEPTSITVHALGELIIVSGRLAGTDPIAPLRVDVLDADIAPGRYPVFLSAAEAGAVALLVRVGDTLPVRWEDATAVGVEPGWASVEVDSGTVAFMDSGLAEALQEERRGFGPSFPVPGGISERMYEAVLDAQAAMVDHEGMNAMIAHVGGDHPYPLAWGRDATGRVVAVAIDCCLLPLCTRPWEPESSDEW